MNSYYYYDGSILIVVNYAKIIGLNISLFKKWIIEKKKLKIWIIELRIGYTQVKIYCCKYFIYVIDNTISTVAQQYLLYYQ